MRRTAGFLLVGAVLLGVGAGLVLRDCRPDQPPSAEGPVDTLPDTAVVAHRPKPGKPNLTTRILSHRVAPRVAVSAGIPDTSLVRRFAQAVNEAESLRVVADSLKQRIAQGDQTAVIAFNHQPKPKRVLPPVAGKYSGKELTLWLSRSDGSLMRATARLRPRWEFYTGMDAGSDTLPIFTADRWYVRLVRQTVHCAPPAGVMAGVGALVHAENRLLGAAIVGGATLLGCLSG